MSTRVRFSPGTPLDAAQTRIPMSQQARKRTQRERLLNGMVAVASRRGYAGANVSAVIEEAGVSRPTFYEYFEDRDACFRAAIEDVQEELLSSVEQTIGETRDAAIAAAVAALVQYACAEPARARFLMSEAMSGGARALEVRDHGIAMIAEAVERATTNVAADTAAPDLEARVVIGAIYRMIATRLRRAEAAIATLAEELLSWLSAYEHAIGELRWQKLSAAAKRGRSAQALEGPIEQMPSPLPPGRPRIPQQEIAENQRLRILHATARLAASKGYMATTVADITTLARVRANTFYRQFADKQEAFTAVHELGFQHVMDYTAKAFFSVEGWPLRSWTAASALTQLLDANPLLANVTFVEAYAVGPGAVQRIEDTHTAFMFFLQEGLPLSKEPPSRVAMEAIIASTFEVIYLQTRAGDGGQIAGMSPYIAHLWLTPFLGAKASDTFIDTQRRKQKAPVKAPR